jgi:hypothetical protein
VHSQIVRLSYLALMLDIDIATVRRPAGVTHGSVSAGRAR